MINEREPVRLTLCSDRFLAAQLKSTSTTIFVQLYPHALIGGTHLKHIAAAKLAPVLLLRNYQGHQVTIVRHYQGLWTSKGGLDGVNIEGPLDMNVLVTRLQVC